MKKFLALLAVLGLFLAACGDDGDSGDSSSNSTESDGDAGSDESDGGAAAGSDSVTIANFAFDAPDAVAAGTTVEVNNTDGATHTFTSADGSFDTGNIASGESATVTFENAGSIDYFCSIHPSMTGSITVEG